MKKVVLLVLIAMIMSCGEDLVEENCMLQPGTYAMTYTVLDTTCANPPPLGETQEMEDWIVTEERIADMTCPTFIEDWEKKDVSFYGYCITKYHDEWIVEPQNFQVQRTVDFACTSGAKCDAEVVLDGRLRAE